MSTKPIHLFYTLNFWLQDAHEIPESVGIVFLYRPGRVVWNFRLCAVIINHSESLKVNMKILELFMDSSTTGHGTRWDFFEIANYQRYQKVHVISLKHLQKLCKF